MILSIALVQYDQVSIMNALIVTAAVTIIMIIVSTIIPNIFLSMGKVLFACLLGVIVFELIFIFIGVYTLSLWDIGVAIIFCGYIGFDWAEAQKKEYTLHNVVNTVANLYLDIVNLFIRIIATGGKISKN